MSRLVEHDVTGPLKLDESDIVHFEQAGRAKQPFVPYETIAVSLELSSPESADEPATV